MRGGGGGSGGNGGDDNDDALPANRPARAIWLGY
jgi:hypothetical protein